MGTLSYIYMHMHMNMISCTSSVCAGEGSKPVAVLHVLSRVPHSGVAEKKGGLGSQTAGPLPRRPQDRIREYSCTLTSVITHLPVCVNGRLQEPCSSESA